MIYVIYTYIMYYYIIYIYIYMYIYIIHNLIVSRLPPGAGFLPSTVV